MKPTKQEIRAWLELNYPRNGNKSELIFSYGKVAEIVVHLLRDLADKKTTK